MATSFVALTHRTDNVNIEAFGPNGSRSSNTLGSGPGGGSAIIVYPNQSANDGSIAGKSAAVPETSEAMLYRDGNQSSSENSSCSFTGAFGSSTTATTTVASTSFEASAQAAGDMQLVSIETMASSSSSSNSTSVQGSYVGMHSTAVVAMETQHPNQQQQNSLGPSNGMEGGSKEGGTGYQSAYKISDNVYKHAIQLEYTRNPLKYEMSGQDDRGLRKLNNLEENRLDEVNQHLRPLCAYVEGNRENKKFITDISEGLQCFEQAIKRIIMAVKNIHSFKCMCQDDQIALLKGSVGEIKGLLNIRYFNPTQELCIVPNPSVSPTDRGSNSKVETALFCSCFTNLAWHFLVLPGSKLYSHHRSWVSKENVWRGAVQPLQSLLLFLSS